MMKVFCYAYEGMYQGLHGIEAMRVMEVPDDLEKAQEIINDWGREASEDLIYSYGLEEEYLADIDWWDDDDEEEKDITQSNYYCDRGWYGCKIREDVNKTINELNDLCDQLGEELFVEEYCEKKIQF